MFFCAKSEKMEREREIKQLLYNINSTDDISGN